MTISMMDGGTTTDIEENPNTPILAKKVHTACLIFFHHWQQIISGTYSNKTKVNSPWAQIEALNQRAKVKDY